jgi:hypothetical protein
MRNDGEKGAELVFDSTSGTTRIRVLVRTRSGKIRYSRAKIQVVDHETARAVADLCRKLIRVAEEGDDEGRTYSLTVGHSGDRGLRHG